MFGDSCTANRILLADTLMECQRLSYKINGVDREKWQSNSYEVCFGGVHEVCTEPAATAVTENYVT